MFGLEFLFGTALWALPLAAAPLLLHMLFRRKSPVVQFSTLRFIKSSIQQTAARKRVQRWLLLACRILLLALLIWAVAQPVRRLATSWFGSGSSIAAAIVVDTSYSMELQEGSTTLLDKADGIIQDLLRDPLRQAKVAIFRSKAAPSDQPEGLESAASFQSQWTALKPQAGRQPLGERVEAAMDLLKRQDAGQKWLIIISDMQRKEFAHPIADFPEGRVILFDLHPQDARAAAVTSVSVEPQQPLPGIGSDVSVEVSGRSGDTRFVALSVKKVDGVTLLEKPPAQVVIEPSGPGRARFDVDLPAQRWMLVGATLQQDEPLPWAKTRSLLVEMPPRQTVTVLDAQGPSLAPKFMRLALESPRADQRDAWPLEVSGGPTFSGHENVVVATLTQWPAEETAARLDKFVRGGGTLLLALQPGLELSWTNLPAGQKKLLSGLLPAVPYAGEDAGAYRAGVSAPGDALLAGLADDKSRFEAITVRRFVPMSVEIGPDVTTILSMSPAAAGPGVGQRTAGLLYRKSVGAGLVYTLATLPEPRYTNFVTHTRFLPLMVRMCLCPPTAVAASNVELGDNLVLEGPQYAGVSQLEIEGPGKELYVVNVLDDMMGRRFVFDKAEEPGIYTWRKPGSAEPLALTNVQYPAAEAQLAYYDGKAIVVPGENTMVVGSFEELQGTMAKIAEPEPKWTWPMAIVLMLLCLEAMMGSISKLWQPIRLKGLIAPPAAPGPG